MNFINNPDEFDQHFLVDKKVIDDFIKTANLSKEDIVVEVGPGKGQISRIIASKVKKLYLIELDERLKEFLNDLVIEYPNVEVIYGSVLKTTIPPCDKLITSLPYSIVEPFMYKMKDLDINELYMITGSNYAHSVTNKEITNLSLLTNCYYDATLVRDILPDSFNPKPRVLSSIIKLIKKDFVSGTNQLFKVLYELNDKKIKNGLIEAYVKTFSKTKREAKEIINSMNIDDSILDIKFENISNDQLKILYKKVDEYGIK